MNIDFPYHFDNRGRTADTNMEDHIRDMIEQILFTSPGERINRPNFGCGLLKLIFAPINDALTGAIQMTIQAALQQWLGDLIRVGEIQVENEETTIKVTVQYTILKTQQSTMAEFSRKV